VVGGRGFVGGHLCERLITAGAEVTSYDLIDGQDARDQMALFAAMRGHDTVFHLASNPDIAAGATHPEIDFYNGTAITSNVVEAARLCDVQTIVYMSGSGVYKSSGTTPLSEYEGCLEPSSPYGASKLAGEALVSAYCHMFGMRGIALRPANIVGPRQTHGVGYDFINRLQEDPDYLTVLGDGQQQKSYIHVDDLVDAVLTAYTYRYCPFSAYNVATQDTLFVWEIAHLAAEILGITPKIEYTGGKAWVGDIPVVLLNTDKIRSLGWNNKRTSYEAMRHALESMV
jgi:UDP-glucose 4-epimerase